MTAASSQELGEACSINIPVCVHTEHAVHVLHKNGGSNHPLSAELISTQSRFNSGGTGQKKWIGQQ
jgi:hypothetical protein